MPPLSNSEITISGEVGGPSARDTLKSDLTISQFVDVV
jgi:hypothetical protein